MSELEFLETLYEMNGEGASKVDATLDHIFQWTDTQFKAGKFAVVDSMLAMIDPQDFGEDLLVGLILSTFPARDELQQWEEFVSRCRYQLDGLLGPVVDSVFFSQLDLKSRCS